MLELIRSFTGSPIRSAFAYATECLTLFSGRPSVADMGYKVA